MPITSKYLAQFYENGIFHVYNRTNSNESLFIEEENYFFFLKKYDHYLSPLVDTFCWNLLPNHFHLMIRIKPESYIVSNIIQKEEKERTSYEKLFVKKEIPLNDLVVRSFTRFFQSYAQSFNTVYSRSGNLFSKIFKRIEILPESQFTSTMVYIHANALKHGLVKDFREHKWSSWHSLISNKPTKLVRDEVLNWFGNKEEFIKAHLELSKFYYDNDIGELGD